MCNLTSNIFTFQMMRYALGELPGTFAPGVDNTNCFECPAGQFQEHEAMGFCDKCDLGK